MAGEFHSRSHRMIILALKPEGFVIPHIHSSMVRAFRSLGNEVIELPFPGAKEDLKKLKSFSSRGNQAIFSIDLPLHLPSRHHIRDMQETLRTPWIIWFVDDPEGYGFPDCCDPARTIVFCWDREIAKTISTDGSWKGIGPLHLPLAADPEIFYPWKGDVPHRFPGGVFVGSTAHANPMLDAAILNSPGFLPDISALWDMLKPDLGKIPGNLVRDFLRKKTGDETGALLDSSLARLWIHAAVYALGKTTRKEIVSAVIGQGGGVFGDRGWERTMGNLCRGQVPYGESLRRVYNHSAFVLDIRQPQARTGLTQRIFDAGACGRPVLTEFSPELDTLFDSQRECLVYRTLQEAQERKAFILSTPGAGQNIGERARNKVLALHTYRHRAEQVLQALQDFLACSRA
jgi:spore maturation protein CgeB